MAKKQKIILLHGNTAFTNKDLIGKGELVIEHGNTAEDVKLHTLDDKGEIATFASQAYVDKEISSANASVSALSETVAAMDAAYKLADSTLDGKITAETEARKVAISAETEAREAAISAETEARKVAISAVSENLIAYSAETAGVIAALEAKNAELEGAIGAEITNRENADNALDARITAITADYLKQADYNALSALTYAETTARTEADNALDVKIAANATAITAETSAREAAISGVSEDIKTNADAISAETEARKVAISGLTEMLSSSNGDLSALKTKVETLIDNDENKSVRTIANEELAAVLISGATDVKESLDTLKEIADWIQSHPDDVSKMNTAILANATAITAETSAREAAITAVTELISANEQAINNEVTARTEAVNALDARITAITDDYLKQADYNALSALTYAETTARTEADNALDAKITANATAITAETSAREKAISALTEAIETAKNAATTKVVEGTDSNDNLSITSEIGADNSTTYTINLSNVAKADELSALDTRVTGVEDTYVKEVKVYNVVNNVVTEQTLTGNTIDLLSMVIDGGTY